MTKNMADTKSKLRSDNRSRDGKRSHGMALPQVTPEISRKIKRISELMGKSMSDDDILKILAECNFDVEEAVTRCLRDKETFQWNVVSTKTAKKKTEVTPQGRGRGMPDFRREDRPAADRGRGRAPRGRESSRGRGGASSPTRQIRDSKPARGSWGPRAGSPSRPAQPKPAPEQPKPVVEPSKAADTAETVKPVFVEAPATSAWATPSAAIRQPPATREEPKPVATTESVPAAGASWGPTPGTTTADETWKETQEADIVVAEHQVEQNKAPAEEKPAPKVPVWPARQARGAREAEPKKEVTVETDEALDVVEEEASPATRAPTSAGKAKFSGGRGRGMKWKPKPAVKGHSVQNEPASVEAVNEQQSVPAEETTEIETTDERVAVTLPAHLNQEKPLTMQFGSIGLYDQEYAGETEKVEGAANPIKKEVEVQYEDPSFEQEYAAQADFKSKPEAANQFNVGLGSSELNTSEMNSGEMSTVDEQKQGEGLPQVLSAAQALAQVTSAHIAGVSGAQNAAVDSVGMTQHPAGSGILAAGYPGSGATHANGTQAVQTQAPAAQLPFGGQYPSFAGMPGGAAPFPSLGLGGPAAGNVGGIPGLAGMGYPGSYEPVSQDIYPAFNTYPYSMQAPPQPRGGEQHQRGDRQKFGPGQTSGAPGGPVAQGQQPSGSAGLPASQDESQRHEQSQPTMYGMQGLNLPSTQFQMYANLHAPYQQQYGVPANHFGVGAPFAQAPGSQYMPNMQGAGMQQKHGQYSFNQSKPAGGYGNFGGYEAAQNVPATSVDSSQTKEVPAQSTTAAESAGTQSNTSARQSKFYYQQQPPYQQLAPGAGFGAAQQPLYGMQQNKQWGGQT